MRRAAASSIECAMRCGFGAGVGVLQMRASAPYKVMTNGGVLLRFNYLRVETTLMRGRRRLTMIVRSDIARGCFLGGADELLYVKSLVIFTAQNKRRPK